MNKIIGLLGLMVVLVGCASTGRLTYVEKQVPGEWDKKDKGALEYFTDSNPDWAYEELGVLTVEGRTPQENVEKIFRREAAKRGADGVIHFKSEWVKRPIYFKTPGAWVYTGRTRWNPNPMNYGLIGQWKMDWAREEAMYSVTPAYFVLDKSMTKIFSKNVKVITGTLVRRPDAI